MSEVRELNEKINEVREELKRHGFWKKNIPAWVIDYEKKEISNHQDFTEWLQFVYLPNMLEQKTVHGIPVALQAKKYFSEDMRKGKLLQLLIELDSLS